MNKIIERPSDTSQLDHLWLNFGDLTVKTKKPSPTPQEDVLITEAVIAQLINKGYNAVISAVSKIADYTDILEAYKTGVILEIGDLILILTLTSGDKVYVNLHKLLLDSIRVSKEEGNILSKDKKGYLYGALTWHNV